MAITGAVPIALIAIGRNELNAVLKPANSGGTMLDSELRGAPIIVVLATARGAGASRTVVTTGPMAPAHATGMARANAAAAWLGSMMVAVAAPTRATAARRIAGAVRWLRKIHPRSSGIVSVRSGRSTSCDNGSSDSRPTMKRAMSRRSAKRGDDETVSDAAAPPTIVSDRIRMIRERGRRRRDLTPRRHTTVGLG
ncbi:MAG: hypothetical protein DRJ50_11570 [Actinobacteria bacterium]|nr:MAG: hypothetical protein DRJ50_11570 [Actinomycetota bacterium]